jgi:hypothetical protein
MARRLRRRPSRIAERCGDAAEDLDDTVFQLLTNDILATR